MSNTLGFSLCPGLAQYFDGSYGQELCYWYMMYADTLRLCELEGAESFSQQDLCATRTDSFSRVYSAPGFLCRVFPLQWKGFMKEFT